MQLQEEDIHEFAQLWKEEFGETLSTDEARYHATRFLELFALLAKPLPQPPAKVPETDSLSSS